MIGMDIGYIYRLWWPNCKHHYVGQTKNLKARVRVHFHKLKQQKHDNIRLQRVYNKYGLPRIKILITAEVSMLSPLEEYFISKNHNEQYCCNILKFAGTVKGLKHTAESRLKMSNSHKGKRLSESHKLKIKQSGLLVVRDKRALSDFFKGANNHKSKIVIDLETGIFYDTLNEATTAKGLHYKRTSSYLSGKRKNKTSLAYA